MKKALFLIFLGALLISRVTIHAQDDGLSTDTPPTHATINLGGDYWLDPFVVSVIAANDVGGAPEMVDVSALDPNCKGFVPRNPSVVLNWTPTNEIPTLRVFFLSTFDPVMVIVKPDGSYACNDDFSPLIVNPLIDIQNPAAGEYRIYVGTYREASPFGPGFLVMTSGPADPATFSLSGLLPAVVRQSGIQLPRGILFSGRDPADDSAITQLSSGFEPMTAQVTGGGAVPAFNVDLGNRACNGFVSVLPSYVFTFTGDPQDVRVFFESDSDSTIAVIAPDGGVTCNDDVATDNLNPAVTIPVTTGRYAVYIGGNDPAKSVSGTLTITGDTSAQPAALAPAEQSS